MDMTQAELIAMAEWFHSQEIKRDKTNDFIDVEFNKESFDFDIND